MLFFTILAISTQRAGISSDNSTYCIMHGRIKDKNSIVFAIKWQMCCIDHTALWLTNTVQLR